MNKLENYQFGATLIYAPRGVAVHSILPENPIVNGREANYPRAAADREKTGHQQRPDIIKNALNLGHRGKQKKSLPGFGPSKPTRETLSMEHGANRAALMLTFVVPEFADESISARPT